MKQEVFTLMPYMFEKIRWEFFISFSLCEGLNYGLNFWIINKAIGFICFFLHELCVFQIIFVFHRSCQIYWYQVKNIPLLSFSTAVGSVVLGVVFLGLFQFLMEVNLQTVTCTGISVQFY